MMMNNEANTETNTKVRAHIRAAQETLIRLDSVQCAIGAFRNNRTFIQANNLLNETLTELRQALASLEPRIETEPYDKAKGTINTATAEIAELQATRAAHYRLHGGPFSKCPTPPCPTTSALMMQRTEERSPHAEAKP